QYLLRVLIEWERDFDRTLNFFFTSRRRHTRFDCDWSSDVCSSDLDSKHANFEVRVFGVIEIISRQLGRHDSSQHPFDGTRELPRSEERRVGKECRSRWSRYTYKDNAKYASIVSSAS